MWFSLILTAAVRQDVGLTVGFPVAVLLQGIGSPAATELWVAAWTVGFHEAVSVTARHHEAALWVTLAVGLNEAPASQECLTVGFPARASCYLDS